MRSSCRAGLGVTIFVAFAAFLVAFTAGPLGFAAAKHSAPMPALASTAGPLDLSVVVSAHNGKPIGGLQQQDFTVYLDGKPQPITGFHAVEGTSANAVPVMLLIDSVNTRYMNVDLERQGIDQFLKKNNGRLSQPVALAILTDTGVQITPQTTRDGNQLAAFLDKTVIGLRAIGHDAGFYGWTEQFQDSASGLERIAALEQSRPGPKALIWMSPGWPLLSGPEVYLTSAQQKSLFTALVRLSTTLMKARITLSSIDPIGTLDADRYQTFYYKNFTNAIRKPSQMQIGNLALQVLALQSGGRVFNSSNDVSGEIADAASDADTFYTIRIDSPPTERPNDYRSISVRVNQPGLTARTRTSYYAQP